MSWILLLFAVFVNVQEILIVKIGWAWISYVDELFLFSAYLLVPFFVRRKEDAWVYLILLLPFFSIIYSLAVNFFVFGEFRFFQSVLQSFINFKFFLYFSSFYAVWLSGRGIDFRNIFIICFFVGILGYALNVLHPDFFIFSDAAWHVDRGRIAGFQFKPNDLALFLSFACLFVLFSRAHAMVRFVGFFVIVVLIYFTSSRTALVLAMMGFFLYLIRSGHFLILLSGALVFFFSGLFFYDNLSGSFFVSETLSNLGEFSRIDNSQYIRAIMVYLSFVLAFDYFPIGVGAGGFGSVMSAGSPVYDLLGVADNVFFVSMTGIYDSGFASVLGEYGFVGLILYLYLLWKVVSVSMARRGIDTLSMFFMAVLLFLVQPFFSYQVNSVNFLLLIFSLRGFLYGR